MNRKQKHTLHFISLASVFLICVSVFLHFPATINSENLGLLKYEINGAFVGNLKHIIRISNPTSSIIAGGKLFVPLVRNQTPYHYVFYNITSSVGDPTIVQDNSGNMYACWNSIVIGENQIFRVEINYCMLSFSTHYIVNSSLIVDYNKNSELYRKYTQPEELIQSDDPAIISKAWNITSTTSNLHEKILKIYNFVTNYLQYAIQDEEKGAVWALENGVGDCSEYSYLFVALCRAAGIPARIQAGFAFKSSSETLKDGHMWAEYYLENYGWVPVDATWQLFDTIDYRHFSSIQSIPEIIPYSNYIFNNTKGPKSMDEQTVILKPCSSSVFGDTIFAENIMKTIKKIKQAQFDIFLGKVLGASVIFPSETEEIDEALQKCKTYLQNAIEFWEAHSQLANSNINNALENAEKASLGAWTNIVKELALFIIPLTIIMLITLVFLKRHRR